MDGFALRPIEGKTGSVRASLGGTVPFALGAVPSVFERSGVRNGVFVAARSVAGAAAGFVAC